MKRFFVQFLALLLIFTLTACGEKTDEDRLQGSWSTSIALGELLDTLEGEDLTFFDNAKGEITISLTFKDGKYTIKTDPKAATQDPEFKAGMKLYMLDILGMIEEEIKASYGKSADDLAKERTQELKATLTINETMEYSFKDGKLYLENEVYEYRFEDNKLYLTLEGFGELEFNK